MADSLIEKYTTAISEYCDAPEIFIKASGYHLISALPGRFCSSLAIPGLSLKGLRPNVWFILSSIPGRTRRSTVQFYDRHIYKKSLSLFYDDEQNKLQKILTSMIEEGSAEGLADHIMDSHNRYHLDCFDIQSPEFGGVLAKTKRGGYEEGLPVILSKLYYGEGWIQLLSRRKGGGGVREIPENLYVTMLAGMQKPELYLSEYMIGQGLLRRIMICYVDTKHISMDNWKPPIRPRVNPIFKELDEISIEISDIMKEFEKALDDSSFHSIDVTIDPRAYRKINELARRCDEQLSGKDETNLALYQQSLWEHLTKLSICESISRAEIKMQSNGRKELFVSIDDYNRARKFLDELEKTNETIIDSIVKSEPFKTIKKGLDKYYAFIEAGGPAGRTLSVLAKKFNDTSKQREEILHTLLQQRRVYYCESKDKPERGQTALTYIATIFKER